MQLVVCALQQTWSSIFSETRKRLGVPGQDVWPNIPCSRKSVRNLRACENQNLNKCVHHCRRHLNDRCTSAHECIYVKSAQITNQIHKKKLWKPNVMACWFLEAFACRCCLYRCFATAAAVFLVVLLLEFVNFLKPLHEDLKDSSAYIKPHAADRMRLSHKMSERSP